ncbi:MAG: thiamine-phosphate kinase [Candidatus Micrarchaeota archaeon]|nr:thiamine-phosphate kinase [Candidatus Micrarchaeota archaeon]
MKLKERELIRSFIGNSAMSSKAIVKVGEDDAAVVEIRGRKIAFTTDSLIRSSHLPKGMKPFDIGRKSVIINASDLASMGAKPEYFLCALGITKNFANSEFDTFARGVRKGCAECGFDLIGGDTKKAREFFISGFAVGEIKGSILRRNNARAGDVVAVTGKIGSAACGLYAMLKGKKIRAGSELLESFTKPNARIGAGLLISRQCRRAACIDITDGLLYSAGEIAKRSKVRIELESGLIPVSKKAEAFAAKHGLGDNYLLNTGEDYELLVCMPERDFERVRGRAGLKRIGEAKSGEGAYLNGKKIDATDAGGYDSFIEFRNR